MLAVRYAALAALVVWLGGMVVLGWIVAPAVVQGLQEAGSTAGSTLSGVVFGEALRQFRLLAYACGAVIFLSLFVMKFVGPPPSSFAIRAAIVALMLGLAAYSGRSAESATNRAAAPGSHANDARPAADDRRTDFARLHQQSASLMTVNIVLGFILLVWYVRD